MARQPRLDLPNVPQHIVQRGNNRAPCFFAEGHRRLYLDLLRDAAPATEVSLHAYVLMTNHVHLLATSPRAGAISALMQAVGRRYVQWINKVRGRTGTLFDGRFKSSLVQSERYLLSCYRYIELNPVRAGLVAEPADYPWSSHHCNALGEPDGLITPHPVFVELGEDVTQRRARYCDLFAEALPVDECGAIRAHLQQNRALGTAEFQARVESITGRSARVTARGRPRKKNGPDPFFIV
jgi:putative transposase